MSETVTRPLKKKRLNREEKAEATRRALFEGAAKIVGQHGYADASIALITAEARVAQGTFYNYFESRQDLFDQLLPETGRVMLDHIKERVDPDASGIDRENQRLRAYFDYLEQNPEFYRILTEAEVFAPAAHEKHIELLIAGYRAAFNRSRERGELNDFDDSEIEVISYLLVAARDYLSMAYMVRGKGAMPDHVFSAYTKLVRNGLFKA